MDPALESAAGLSTLAPRGPSHYRLAPANPTKGRESRDCSRAQGHRQSRDPRFLDDGARLLQPKACGAFVDGLTAGNRFEVDEDGGNDQTVAARGDTGD